MLQRKWSYVSLYQELTELEIPTNLDSSLPQFLDTILKLIKKEKSLPLQNLKTAEDLNLFQQPNLAYLFAQNLLLSEQPNGHWDFPNPIDILNIPLNYRKFVWYNAAESEFMVFQNFQELFFELYYAHFLVLAKQKEYMERADALQNLSNRVLTTKKSVFLQEVGFVQEILDYLAYLYQVHFEQMEQFKISATHGRGFFFHNALFAGPTDHIGLSYDTLLKSQTEYIIKQFKIAETTQPNTIQIIKNDNSPPIHLHHIQEIQALLLAKYLQVTSLQDQLNELGVEALFFNSL